MDILTLAQSKTQLKKISGTHGGEWVGPCPDCGGRDRFHVWPDKHDSKRYERVGIYWCRSCGKSGDVVKWFVDFEGMSYMEAFRAIGEEMPSGYRNRYDTPRPPVSGMRHGASGASKNAAQEHAPGEKDPPSSWTAKAAALVEFAAGQLSENKYIMGWLKKRGISKKTATGMRLGWLEKDRWRPRDSWGLEQVKKDDGSQKKLWLPAGLVIPMINPDNSIARIRIRRFANKEPRYYVVPGSRMASMAHNLPHRAAVIVESELDAIMLAERIGELAGVVALGSATAKPGHALAKALSDSSVILVALDSDRAGAEAMRWWAEAFQRSKRWPVPEGKDPGEAFAEGVDVAEWVKAGLPAGWFLGPSPVGLVQKRAGIEEPSAACACAHDGFKKDAAVGKDDDCGPIEELFELLRNNPVEVRVVEGGKRIWIRQNEAWKRRNWETSRRISELVFMTQEVLDYLLWHGSEIINGKNFWKEVR